MNARRRRFTQTLFVVLAAILTTTSLAADNSTSTVSSRDAQETTASVQWNLAGATKAARRLAQGVDRQAPSVPAHLLVTAVSTTSITLSWDASRDAVGVTGYGVYRNNVRVATTTARSYKLSALTCGTTYTIGVDAYDAARNRSGVASVLAASSPCLDTVAPSAPAGLRQSGWSTTGAGVEWSAATDNVGVAGYTVYRDGVPVATTQQNTAWVGNLVCGAGHSVAVDAYDAAGNHSARTSAVVATTACSDTTPPGPPRNLRVSASSHSGISVAWEPALDDRGIAAYRVSLNDISMQTTTATSATFMGLACGRSYAVEVVAEDAAGNLSAGARLTAPTAACPSSSRTRRRRRRRPGSCARRNGLQHQPHVECVHRQRRRGGLWDLPGEHQSG